MAPHGSHDNGDGTTTNLYVGNLPPEVNEQVLLEEFCKFGDIASVKIMWPRSEEERARQRNCGFVSFMKRHEAADALAELRDKVFHGHKLHLGWGKKVQLPAQALLKKNRAQKNQGFGPSASAAGAGASEAPPQPDLVIPSGALRFDIKVPEDRRLRKYIDKLASFVSKLGHVFEKVCMPQSVCACVPVFQIHLVIMIIIIIPRFASFNCLFSRPFTSTIIRL